jgi:hypothetical protein
LTDVTEWTEEEARSRLQGEELVEGQTRHLIELVPAGKEIGYARIVIALAKDDLVMRRMELFAEAAEPVKVLSLDRIEAVDGIPTARSLVMRQPPEGTHTTVDISEVRYDQDLPDKLFTKRALERALE